MTDNELETISTDLYNVFMVGKMTKEQMIDGLREGEILLLGQKDTHDITADLFFNSTRPEIPEPIPAEDKKMSEDELANSLENNDARLKVSAKGPHPRTRIVFKIDEREELVKSLTRVNQTIEGNDLCLTEEEIKAAAETVLDQRYSEEISKKDTEAEEKFERAPLLGSKKQHSDEKGE